MKSHKIKQFNQKFLLYKRKFLFFWSLVGEYNSVLEAFNSINHIPPQVLSIITEIGRFNRKAKFGFQEYSLHEARDSIYYVNGIS
jgi:hypothetical protein